MSTFKRRDLPIWLIRSLLLSSAVSTLMSCAPVSAVVSDNMPMWLGGMPKDVPPRRGTPEFDEWMKKRNEDAAAIKPAGTPEIDKWMKKRAGSGTGQDTK